MNGMLYDVAVVEDNGENYIVSYTTKSDFKTFDIGSKYIKISSEAKRLIDEYKEKGYPVLLPKGVRTEILPGMVIVLKPKTDLDSLKNISEYRVNSVINYVLETMSIIDVYAYTAIFSKFASRGIFITDENIDKVKELYTLDPASIQDRDDAYVNIIMSESKEDLEDLQILVDSMDKMKRVYDVFKEIKNTCKKIRNAETEEEITNITNIFINKFNFPSD